MALIALVAAVAAYVLWPSAVPEQPRTMPLPEVHEPIVPGDPIFPAPVQIPASDAADEPDIAEDASVSVEDPLDEPITAVASLTLPFFDDLAQRLVDRYHPAGSEHNPGDKGVFVLSLSALNRAYGVDMIGLQHAAPSVLEAREEIFDALLRPDTIAAAMQAFTAYFQQALIDQALSAQRAFVAGDNTYVERPLSIHEVAEFLRLASASMRRLAQAVRIYVQSEQSVLHTVAWQNSRLDALAANARYQYAEDLLQQTLADSPEDGEKIQALRQERDAASQEILEAIATREHLKGVLLSRFEKDALTKKVFEGDLLYVSQWLGRRLVENPERRDALSAVAVNVQEFADQLQTAAETITAPVPE